MEINRKIKIVAIIAAILIASLVAVVVYALSPLLWTSSNSAHNAGTIGAVLTLDGGAYADGDPINWGTVEASTLYSKPLTVENTGTASFTVTLATTDLPTGWQMSLYTNGEDNVVDAGETVSWDVNLVTATALTGDDYAWTSTITATP